MPGSLKYLSFSSLSCPAEHGPMSVLSFAESHQLLWTLPSYLLLASLPGHFYWFKNILVLISDKFPLFWSLPETTPLPCYIKILGQSVTHYNTNLQSRHCSLIGVSGANDGGGWKERLCFFLSCDKWLLPARLSSNCPLATDMKTSKLCTFKGIHSIFLYSCLYYSSWNSLASLQSCS